MGEVGDELGTGRGVGRTYDADLQVVSWSAEEDFLFLNGLFGRHSFLGLCEGDGGG